MARTEQNIRVYQGDALRIRVPIADPDGNRVDLSGAIDVLWAAADAADSTTAYIRKTLTGGDIGFRSAYELTFMLASADTASLSTTGANGGYYHEARVIRGNGNPYTILSGRLFVLPSLNEGL